MKRLNVSFAELDNIIDSYTEWRNKVLGINIDHSKVKLTAFGAEFAFGVYDEFTLWDSDGSTSLGRCGIDRSLPPTSEFMDWLYQIIDDYSHKIIHCSDCGRSLPNGNHAGRYFAGVYCKDCWERKWRAIEAAEDYE